MQLKVLSKFGNLQLITIKIGNCASIIFTPLHTPLALIDALFRPIHFVKS